MKQILSAARMLFVLTILTGVIYPACITLIAAAMFPAQAGGSLIMVNGRAVGSALLGQKTTAPGYFWPRPSATGYNPLPSGASNQGPTSAALQAAVETRRAEIWAIYNLPSGVPIPTDLLFASGSGLDPHLSPAAARLQTARVAAARGLSAAQQQQLAVLVEQAIESPQWGLLGQARVNVLKLNLAVDETYGNASP
jgi:K+-transporting ATPase ATPase C chain